MEYSITAKNSGRYIVVASYSMLQRPSAIDFFVDVGGAVHLIPECCITCSCNEYSIVMHGNGGTCWSLPVMAGTREPPGLDPVARIVPFKHIDCI